MVKFLAFTSYLLARITLTLITSFAITVVFKRSIFRDLTIGFNLVILNFELPSTFLHALRKLFEKYDVEIIVF